MGQWYRIANLDKQEYLLPARCGGDGSKLMEFGVSSFGTMSCLALLLAEGNGRGAGDLDSENPIIGSWAGDRIVIIGDYADRGRFSSAEDKRLFWEIAREGSPWVDVSTKAMGALRDDAHADEQIRRHRT